MMAGHTTFKAGGPVTCFIEAEDLKTLRFIMELLNENEEEYFLLGNGSNLLVSDKGYDGIVVKLSGSFADVVIGAEDALSSIFESTDTDTDGAEYIRIKAGAAASLASVALRSADASLTGMEFASGIPGTIGGAIVMNAGAYGGEMKEIVEYVTRYDVRSGLIVRKNAEEMRFSYRDSIVRHEELIVLETGIRLKKGDPDRIRELIGELKEKRFAKQPLEYPSAGSTFKRPEGYFAGKLIEDSGLKGYSIGDAQVSKKHCGFVINRGKATASDIMSLVRHVQKTVMDRQGVMLEPEIIFLGEF